jgi:hydrogenase/urease accessory protein HupE
MKHWFLLPATLYLGMLLPVQATFAHEVRPAYLQITQRDDHRYDVLWKQPANGEFAVRLNPRLSSGWLDAAADTVQMTPGFLIKVWHVTTADGEFLDGQTLVIEGLEQTITDALVDVTLADGRQLRTILKPQNPTMQLTLHRAGSIAVPAYLALGIEHILTGIDHLMFVLGLILLVKNRWQLLKTITAFTVAHSITLAATALGVVQLQSAVVESLVALSIVFLALELVRAYSGGRPTLTTRFPWVIALIFGLLHGFAFAGAIAEIGLPPHDIPLSLLLFNVGVEIGQLAFVAAVLALIALLRRLPRPLPRHLPRYLPRYLQGTSRWLLPYAIGSFAAFWFIERIVLIV